MLLEPYIIPSPIFENFVKQHFLNSAEKSPDTRIRQFANYCTVRLNFLLLKPRAPILPSISMLIRAKEAPFVKSVFRSTLEQMMEYQKQSFPNLEIPVIVKTLIDLIIQSGGLTSIGIFRVTPQLDEISKLRVKLEESHGGPIPMVDPELDPNVSACLLKVWLAEIIKPLIPTEYYHAVTNSSKDWPSLEKIIHSFPTIYRNTLYYLINFLQRVVKEDNKMNEHNISIVISPTLCRCPIIDTTQLMKQTVIESEFCLTVLKNLPCVYIFGK